MIESVSLIDFIMCFELDTYIEIYSRSSSDNYFIYGGLISTFIENSELSSKYTNCKIEHGDASIDPPGAVMIIINQ